MGDKILKVLLAAAALCVAATFAVLFIGDDDEEVPQAKPAARAAPRPVREKPRPAVAPRPVEPAATSVVAAVKKPKGMYTHLEEEDRKIALAIQDALDAEDFDRIQELVDRARRAKNAEVRRLLVEALSWFNVRAMFLLAPFLNDEDEEVRAAAAAGWEQVLGHVEDEQIKAGLILESMQIVKDENAADMIASELHGIDEKLALETMIKLLYGTLTVSKAARSKIIETYQFITGEEYSNAANARAWLRENYTPPEKEDE